MTTSPDRLLADWVERFRTADFIRMTDPGAGTQQDHDTDALYLDTIQTTDAIALCNRLKVPIEALLFAVLGLAVSSVSRSEKTVLGCITPSVDGATVGGSDLPGYLLLDFSTVSTLDAAVLLTAEALLEARTGRPIANELLKEKVMAAGWHDRALCQVTGIIGSSEARRCMTQSHRETGWFDVHFIWSERGLSFGADTDRVRFRPEWTRAFLELIAYQVRKAQSGALLDAFMWDALDYDTKPVPSSTCPDVLDIFETHRRSHPHRILALDEHQAITYREADDMAWRVSGYIIDKGIPTGSLIALLACRSALFLPAVLGVWRAGCVFIPLDPEMHPDRLRNITERAAPSLVLGLDRSMDSVCPFLNTVDLQSAAASTDRTAMQARQNQDAYVIFTSGSTGQPKGVVVSHGNLAHYTTHMSAFIRDVAPSSNEPMISAVASTLAADLGYTAIFPIMALGGTVTFIPREASIDARRFAGWLRKHRVDLCKIVPTHLFHLVRHELHELMPRSVLIFGGEELSFKALARARAAASEVRILNHYGPTETTIGALVSEVTEARGPRVPLGYPIGATCCHVVDHRQRPLPPILGGELFISGPGVTRTLGSDDDVSSCLPGFERGIATGDIVQGDAAGEFFFVRRADRQMKVNGFRIDLAEVEAALRRICNLKNFVLITEGGRLILFQSDDPTLSDSTISDKLLQALSAYMIPSRVIFVSAIPVTLNGKVNTNALLAKLSERNVEEGTTGVDSELIAIWRQELGSDAESAHTIYQLGGNSLDAVRIVAAVNQVYGCDLKSSDLLRRPTLHALQDMVRNAEPLKVQHRSPSQLQLSSFQSRLWTTYRISPEDPSHTVPITLSLEPSSADRLASAVRYLFDTHVVLRLRFREETDGPVVFDDPDFTDVVRIVDDEADLLALARSPVSLDRERPFAVFQCGSHALVRFHHILTDGYSTRRFLTLLDRALSGSDLGEIDGEVFIEETRSTSQDAIARWKSLLEGTAALEWPRLSQDSAHDMRNGLLCHSLSSRARIRAGRLAAQLDMSQQALFLSVCTLALGYLCNTCDVTHLMPVSKRRSKRDLLQLGPRMDLMACRLHIDPKMASAEFLEATRDAFLTQLNMSDVDFKAVAYASGLINWSGVLVPNHMFVWQEDDSPTRNFAHRYTEVNLTKVDLTTTVTSSSREINLRFDYRSDVLSPWLVKKLASMIERLLEEITVDKPLNALPFVDHESVRLVRIGTQNYQPIDLVEEFQIYVDKHPDAPAVVMEDKVLSYGDLDAASSALAKGLVVEGGAGKRVGLLLPRSIDLVVATLASLKAGMSFVPLDVQSPEHRNELIKRSAGLDLVLTPSNIQSLMHFGDALEAPRRPLDGFCYVLFTSGSTGVPKGVPIRHRQLANYLSWARRIFDLQSGDTIPLFTSAAYDFTLTSLLLPLICGARIDVHPQHTGMAVLDQVVSRSSGYAMVKVTPTHLRLIVARGQHLHSGLVVVGGEQLTYGLLEAIHPAARVINEYGPTETTIGSVSYEIGSRGRKDTPVPIGKPIDGTAVAVMGKFRQPVPDGVLGEIVIGGEGVFTGYLDTHDDPLTEMWEAAHQCQVYRTGDYGAWNSDGELVYAGRGDRRVKLHGHRVDLGDIEAAIRNCKDVKSCEVAVLSRHEGSVLAAVADVPDVPALRRQLHLLLPPHMVPSEILLPSDTVAADSGKIDWDATFLRQGQEMRGTDFPNAQRAVQACWKEALARDDEVSIDQNFFDAGGDSRSLLKLQRIFNARFDALITIAELFTHTTIRQQAAFFDKPPSKSDPPRHPARKKPTTLSALSTRRRRMNPSDGY